MDLLEVVLLSVCVVVSIILVYFERCQSDKMHVYISLFIHQFWQLTCLYSGLIVLYANFFHEYKIRYWYLIFMLISLIYLVIQNHVVPLIFGSKTLQTCVLSQYTNYECSFQQNAFLKDIQYWIGLKKDGNSYNKYYHNYVNFLLSLYILIYVKSYLLKKLNFT